MKIKILEGAVRDALPHKFIGTVQDVTEVTRSRYYFKASLFPEMKSEEWNVRKENAEIVEDENADTERNQ